MTLVSDCNDEESTVVLQTAFVMNLFSSLVPRACFDNSFTPRTISRTSTNEPRVQVTLALQTGQAEAAVAHARALAAMQSDRDRWQRLCNDFGAQHTELTQVFMAQQTEQEAVLVALVEERDELRQTLMQRDASLAVASSQSNAASQTQTATLQSSPSSSSMHVDNEDEVAEQINALVAAAQQQHAARLSVERELQEVRDELEACRASSQEQQQQDRVIVISAQRELQLARDELVVCRTASQEDHAARLDVERQFDSLRDELAVCRADSQAQATRWTDVLALAQERTEEATHALAQANRDREALREQLNASQAVCQAAQHELEQMGEAAQIELQQHAHEAHAEQARLHTEVESLTAQLAHANATRTELMAELSASAASLSSAVTQQDASFSDIRAEVISSAHREADAIRAQVRKECAAQAAATRAACAELEAAAAATIQSVEQQAQAVEQERWQLQQERLSLTRAHATQRVVVDEELALTLPQWMGSSVDPRVDPTCADEPASRTAAPAPAQAPAPAAAAAAELDERQRQLLESAQVTLDEQREQNMSLSAELTALRQEHAHALTTHRTQLMQLQHKHTSALAAARALQQERDKALSAPAPTHQLEAALVALTKKHIRNSCLVLAAEKVQAFLKRVVLRCVVSALHRWRRAVDLARIAHTVDNFLGEVRSDKQLMVATASSKMHSLAQELDRRRSHTWRVASQFLHAFLRRLCLRRVFLHWHNHNPRVPTVFFLVTFFESLHLVILVSDSKRTMILLTILVMTLFSSLVPYTRILSEFMPRTSTNEAQALHVTAPTANLPARRHAVFSTTNVNLTSVLPMSASGLDAAPVSAANPFRPTRVR